MLSCWPVREYVLKTTHLALAEAFVLFSLFNTWCRFYCALISTTNHWWTDSFHSTLAAKQTLASFIVSIRDMLGDPEKMQGVKLTKDEKVRLHEGWHDDFCLCGLRWIAEKCLLNGNESKQVAYIVAQPLKFYDCWFSCWELVEVNFFH